MRDTPPSLSLEPSACDATTAQARVLSLFLVRDPAQRAEQLALIRDALGEAMAQAVATETQRSDQLERPAKLALLQSALPALATMAHTAMDRLLDTLTELTRRRGRVSLTETLFKRIVKDALNPPPTRTRVAPEPAALRRHCNLLLSIVAHAGHHSAAVIAEAYARGTDRAPLDDLGALVPRDQIRLPAVDQALDALITTAPAFRDAFVRALSETTRHDGRVTAIEAELLAAIGTLLGSTAHLAVPVVAAPTAYAPEIEPDEVALAVASEDENTPGDWYGEDRLPLQALIIANLIPLLGVLFFGWDALSLLMLYWMENLVVGGYTLLRMLHAGGLKALFPAAFFTFHYSFFCAGHGFIIVGISTIGTDIEHAAFDFDDGPFPFGMLWNLLRLTAELSPGLLTLPLLAFIVSHGISTFVNHFVRKEDAGRKPEDIMFDPYKRIVALHIAILLGSFAVVGTGAGSAVPALLILIVIKIAIDLHQHRAAHRKRRAESRQIHNDSML